MDALVVRETPDGEREAAMLRWGLVPAWAKDPAIGSRMFNARAEGVADKPAFRAAFRRRRCLVPADGFYEWQPVAGGRKQPYFIRLASGAPLALAGLWEHWRGPDGNAIATFTIVTTAANEAMRALHDRMPVLVAPADYDEWLSSPNPSALLGPWAGEPFEIRLGEHARQQRAQRFAGPPRARIIRRAMFGKKIKTGYESDATRMIRELLDLRPEIADEQKKGRSLWWDRKLDSTARGANRRRASRRRVTSIRPTTDPRAGPRRRLAAAALLPCALGLCLAVRRPHHGDDSGRHVHHLAEEHAGGEQAEPGKARGARAEGRLGRHRAVRPGEPPARSPQRRLVGDHGLRLLAAPAVPARGRRVSAGDPHRAAGHHQLEPARPGLSLAQQPERAIRTPTTRCGSTATRR